MKNLIFAIWASNIEFYDYTPIIFPDSTPTLGWCWHKGDFIVGWRLKIVGNGQPSTSDDVRSRVCLLNKNISVVQSWNRSRDIFGEGKCGISCRLCIVLHHTTFGLWTLPDHTVQRGSLQLLRNSAIIPWYEATKVHVLAFSFLIF